MPHDHARTPHPRASKCVTLPLLTLCMLSALHRTGAAETLTTEPASEPTTTRLTISPAQPADPPLRHTLLPTWDERLPGNAVVEYGKVKAEQNYLFSNYELWQRIGDLALPEATTLDDVKESTSSGDLQFVVGSGGSVFNYLRRGARCVTADWQLDVRNTENPLYGLLLPEVQEQRTFGRFFAARTRALVAQQDFDKAVENLKYALAHGRHLEETQITVGTLVGLAITNMHLGTLQELIQQPGAPSLLNALHALPRPFLSPSRGIEAEQFGVLPSIDAFRNLEDGRGDEAYWLKRLERGLLQMSEDYWTREEIPTKELALITMRAYTPAKQILSAAGYSPEELETIPVGRVILLAIEQEHTRRRDRVMLITSLPLHRGIQEAAKLESEISNLPEEVSSVYPLPTRSYLQAHARTARQFAALRILEAIRLHAGSHNGTLPPSLETLSELTELTDPSTGRNFELERIDDRSLRLRSPEIAGLSLDWIVQLREPE